MQSPKLSIVMAAYNCEKTIKHAIDSVLLQKYSNWELIITNDGSYDKTLDICKEYEQEDKRIKVLNQKNKGVSAARNLALYEVSGEYLMFLDADDYYSSGAFEILISKINELNPKILIFGLTMKKENDEEIIIPSRQNKKFSDSVSVSIGVISSDIDYGGGFIANKLYATDLFYEGNIPLFDTELFFYEDKLWFLNILAQCDIVHFCNQSLYNYMIYQSSLSHGSESYIARIINRLVVFDKILKDIDDKNDKYKVAVITEYIRVLINTLYYLFRYNKDKYRFEIYRLKYINENQIYIKKMALKIRMKYLILRIVSFFTDKRR